MTRIELESIRNLRKVRAALEEHLKVLRAESKALRSQTGSSPAGASRYSRVEELATEIADTKDYLEATIIAEEHTAEYLTARINALRLSDSRAKEILIGTYVECLSSADIAEKMSYAPSRVSQIRCQAWRELGITYTNFTQRRKIGKGA